MFIKKVLSSACNKKAWDLNHGVIAVANLVSSATLSDEQVKDLSIQFCNQQDDTYEIAPSNSEYHQRLQRIAWKILSVNNINLNYKVYIVNDLNAFSFHDGSIRVYSGLMDNMTDDELFFVLGHEVGHIILGHSKKKLQVSYATAAARYSIGMYTPAGKYSNSFLGTIAENMVKNTFSQSKELDADAYGLKLIQKNHRSTQAVLTALNKLQGSGGFLSTHPSSKKRMQKIREALGETSKE